MNIKLFKSWLLSPNVFDIKYFLFCAVAPVALFMPESLLLKVALVIIGSALGIMAYCISLRDYPGLDRTPE